MFAVFRAKKGSKPVRVSPEYSSPERCAEYFRLLIATAKHHPAITARAAGIVITGRTGHLDLMVRHARKG